MKQKLERLLEFQKSEMEIGRLRKILDAVPEKLDEKEARKTELQEGFETEKESMAVLKKGYREMESDVQANTDLIAKSQEKLGAVKTNKEYLATLKEIEDIEQKNSQIEDDMLLSLEQMETAEAQIAEKGEALVQILAQLTAEMDDLRKEADEQNRHLEEARLLREALLTDVDPSLMADYERVKKITRTPTVVSVINAVCQGCHLNIPPQTYIELQRGRTLNFCPHCGRIIFWEDAMV